MNEDLFTQLSVSSQNITIPDKFRVLWQQNCTYLITIKYLYNPLKRHDPHLWLVKQFWKMSEIKEKEAAPAPPTGIDKLG